MDSYKATPDIEVITSSFPIPGFGFVPINAFVIKGSEPILVDTHAVVESADFMPMLRSISRVDGRMDRDERCHLRTGSCASSRFAGPDGASFLASHGRSFDSHDAVCATTDGSQARRDNHPVSR
jgi:hypothetical protein